MPKARRNDMKTNMRHISNGQLISPISWPVMVAVLITLPSISLGCQNKPTTRQSPLPGDTDFEQQIPSVFTHVYRIGNFYIMGTDQRPRETDRQDRTGEEVVLEAVRLFSSLLDNDADGQIDHPELLNTMGEKFAFAIGYDQTLRPIEEQLDQKTGHYIISMKTDIWPFFPDWNGTGFKVKRLNSSMWRPRRMSALWEECFHVYTEAWNRHTDSWSFGKDGLLGRAMTTDIKANDYDIQEQNRIERGGYDWNTAVNEYVHQIWVIQKGDQTAALTKPQQRVLKFMQQTKGFAMDMDKNYSGRIAVRVR